MDIAEEDRRWNINVPCFECEEGVLQAHVVSYDGRRVDYGYECPDCGISGRWLQLAFRMKAEWNSSKGF